jgi:hypothetical protein
MEKVVKYRTKDRWGNSATSTRTDWIEQSQINADGKGYSGHRVIDFVVDKLSKFDRYITDILTDEFLQLIKMALILLAIVWLSFGGISTYYEMSSVNEYPADQS